MDKTGKMQIEGWTIIVGLIAAYVVIAPFRSFVDDALGGIGGAPTPSGPVIECIYDGAVMTIGPVLKRYAPTTAVTSVGHRLFINGVDRGLKVDGATIDVTYADEIEIFYAENMTDTTGTNNFKYYTAKQEFLVPCVSTLSTGSNKLDPELKHQLIVGALPTITVYNDDDGLRNNAGSGLPNETMVANDEATFDLKIVKGSKAGFSPFGQQAICFRYNTSLYDDIDLSAVSGTTGDLTTLAATTLMSQNGKLGTKSGMGVKCWQNSGTHGKKVVTEWYSLYLSTGTPTPTAFNQNPGAKLNISMYDQSWFKDSDTGEMVFDWENDNNYDVGLTASANKTVIITS